MTNDSVFFEGTRMKVYSANTVIIGAGASGLNAALTLYDKGQKDIILLTDSLKDSTTYQSAAPGQAYGKLALEGGTADSPVRMARALAAAGAMDGDIALTEAASSIQNFQRLIESGVDFPISQWGEYLSEDPEKRRSSAGPQTARKMQQTLLKKVEERGIAFFQGYQVIRIFTDTAEEKVVGVLALDRSGVRESYQRYVLFNCTNVIAAAGAPSGLYYREAYPAKHGSLMGTALEAGVRGINLTDWQFGLCGKEIPLLITGSLLKARPRFVSEEKDKGGQEFLSRYVSDSDSLETALNLKEGTWGFEVKKVRAGGPALIDLAVWEELRLGRKVYLDYRYNEEGSQVQELPFQRLKKQDPAIYAYLEEQGMDPALHRIQIQVAPAHMRGGLLVNTDWETSLGHFFAVGELAGTQAGIGDGSSLNDTQVGSSRAAARIAQAYGESPLSVEKFIAQIRDPLHQRMEMTETFQNRVQRASLTGNRPSLRGLLTQIGQEMEESGGILRNPERLKGLLEKAAERLPRILDQYLPLSVSDLPLYFHVYDLCICQITVLSAIEDYLRFGGRSRGSFLIYDRQGMLPEARLPEEYRFRLSDAVLNNRTQEISYNAQERSCQTHWRPIHPIPEEKTKDKPVT